MVRITSVKAVLPASLAVTLADGRELTVNVADYLASPGYEGLAKPEVFATVELEEWGHGVGWLAIDQGIGADTLVRLAKEQSGDAFPVEAFNAWLERNHLSLSQAAKALGLTRRAIVYYHGGYRPIPKYIGLACKGWEATAKERAA
jgi:hypothetical protein